MNLTRFDGIKERWPKFAAYVAPYLAWMKSHKLKTCLYALLAFVLMNLITMPWFGIPSLRSNNPSETAFMRYDADRAEDAGKPFKKRQQWVPLSRISKSCIEAIIVAEDGTFWSHSGFDWFEFKESLIRNWKAKRAVRGASTITQQLVKNLYLSASKNPLRKLKEWMLTWYIEQMLPKGRILEIYLNVIEFGNGIYGVEAASRAYFGKSAAQLTPSESARLAAIIPSPKKHKANEDSRYVLRRSAIIQRRMYARRAPETPSAPAVRDTTGTQEEETILQEEPESNDQE